MQEIRETQGSRTTIDRAAEFARELKALVHVERKLAVKKRYENRASTVYHFYNGRNTGFTIVLQQIHDLAAKHGVKLEGGE